MADFLSRSIGDKVGKFYTNPEPDEDSVQEVLNVNSLEFSSLEEVSLQTLSPKALAESQALCPVVKCHKEGNGPKSVKMGNHKIDGFDIYCGNQRIQDL